MCITGLEEIALNQPDPTIARLDLYAYQVTVHIATTIGVAQPVSFMMVMLDTERNWCSGLP